MKTSAPVPLPVETVLRYSFLVGISLCLVSPAFGQAVPTSLDVVIALDNSASMRDNDPNRLMPTALRGFITRLPPNTSVGLVRFDRNAQTLLELSPIGDGTFSDRFAAALNKIQYAGQRTDIAGGVERAIYDLRSMGRKGETVRRAVLLVTDGTVDLGNPGANKERTAWLHGALTKEAVRERVAVFGVAFTYIADFQLLQTLSVETSGKPFLIEKPSRISPVLDDIAAALGRPWPQPVVQAPPPPPPPPPPRGVSWVAIGVACLALSLLVLGALVVRRLALPADVATLASLGSTPQTFTIQKRLFRIGRKPRVGLRRMDLVISDKEKFVGRFHAEIYYRRGQFYLRDHSSVHGTFVSEPSSTRLRKLKRDESVLLVDGCRVAFSSYEYVFSSSAPDLQHGGSDETNREGPTSPDFQGKAVCVYHGAKCVSSVTTKWKSFPVCSECRAEIDGLNSRELSELAERLELALRDQTTDRT